MRSTWVFVIISGLIFVSMSIASMLRTDITALKITATIPIFISGMILGIAITNNKIEKEYDKMFRKEQKNDEADG